MHRLSHRLRSIVFANVILSTASKLQQTASKRRFGRAMGLPAGLAIPPDGRWLRQAKASNGRSASRFLGFPLSRFGPLHSLALAATTSSVLLRSILWIARLAIKR